MPLIYIPEEASYYAGNRKLPDNQLYNLCDMLEKKLSVKVQSNLAQFKIDIQNLKKAVDKLKSEQK
jgi:hypothetical protein